MAVLVIFVLDKELEGIEFVHLGMVVCHAGRQIADPSSINDFLDSIMKDLEFSRSKGGS